MSEVGDAVVWSGIRHVLGVRLDNMGDVLMTTPALRALRTIAGRVTLLTSSAGAVLAPHLAEVDEVMEYDASWVKGPFATAARDREAIQRVAALHPDAAVIFTVYSQSALPAALMLHLAGVPRVLAYSRENPYQLLSDWVREPEPAQIQRHEVLRQLELVEKVGAATQDSRLGFLVRPVDREGLWRKLARCGVKERGGWIAAHGGASASSRRYPARLFAQALDGLRQEGRRMLLLGGAENADFAAAVARHSGLARDLVDLSGALTLGELGAAIGASDVFVCNNSGPAHIAAALQVPIVELYALTNPQHTPWQAPQRVLNSPVPCRNCYRSVCPYGEPACLAGVTPGQVVQAARELLSMRATVP